MKNTVEETSRNISETVEADKQNTAVYRKENILTYTMSAREQVQSLASRFESPSTRPNLNKYCCKIFMIF